MQLRGKLHQIGRINGVVDSVIMLQQLVNFEVGVADEVLDVLSRRLVVLVVTVVILVVTVVAPAALQKTTTS